MTSSGDYTNLRQIIGNYSFNGDQAWTTSSPIITTNTTSGALQLAGGAIIQGSMGMSGVFNITNTTPATSVTTGALQVAGGASIAGKTFMGNSVNILDTTPTTSIGTGALQVAGGASIGGNLFVGTTQVPIIQYGVTISGGTNIITLTRSYTNSSSYLVLLTFRSAVGVNDTLYYNITGVNTFTITASQPVSWVAIGT